VERPTSNSFIFVGCLTTGAAGRISSASTASHPISMIVRQWSQRKETGATFFRQPNPNGAESIRLTAITFQFASKQSQATRLLSHSAIPNWDSSKSLFVLRHCTN
jgi:hypothetical protein